MPHTREQKIMLTQVLADCREHIAQVFERLAGHIGEPHLGLAIAALGMNLQRESRGSVVDGAGMHASENIVLGVGPIDHGVHTLNGDGLL